MTPKDIRVIVGVVAAPPPRAFRLAVVAEVRSDATSINAFGELHPPLT
jgi:hypothetical protein